MDIIGILCLMLATFRFTHIWFNEPIAEPGRKLITRIANWMVRIPIVRVSCRYCGETLPAKKAQQHITEKHVNAEKIDGGPFHQELRRFSSLLTPIQRFGFFLTFGQQCPKCVAFWAALISVASWYYFPFLLYALAAHMLYSLFDELAIPVMSEKAWPYVETFQEKRKRQREQRDVAMAKAEMERRRQAKTEEQEQRKAS